MWRSNALATPVATVEMKVEAVESCICICEDVSNTKPVTQWLHFASELTQTAKTQPQESPHLPAPEPIDVPRSSLEQIFAHARESFPNECCGWITGDKDSNTAGGVRRAINAYEPETHPTAKDRTAQTAFVISDQDLLDLNHTLDDDVRPRIIYHSHPNGMAYLSDIDRSVATSPWGGEPAFPVQQLVIGIDAEAVRETSLFAWSEDEDGFVQIARFDGARI